MNRSMLTLSFMTAASLAAASVSQATQVVDTFDPGSSPTGPAAGTNPNQWAWTNGGGGHAVIQSRGGNPLGWLDSGSLYFSDHPNLTSVPPVGTALRAALDSGTLVSASTDVQRLDTSGVNNCNPFYDLPSTFSLSLFDMHTINTSPPTIIEAHTTDGPASSGDYYGWTNLSFTIPSGELDVPRGWVLNAPTGYTWQDLMRNIDGIRFWMIDPADVTYDACWEFGADNVTVTY